MMKYSIILVFCLAVLCSASWDRNNRQVIENGSKIFNDGTKLIITEPNGNVAVHEIAERKHNTRDSGWIASVWSYSNYSYYSAQWQVPSTPSQGGQILFYFNSFESSQYNDILQPVLQFNNGVSGWTLASWYGDSAGKYYEATPSPVNPGDTITGVIQLQGNTWYVYGYVNGNLKSTISVSYSVVAAQGNAQFAMEVYDINNCAQYPPSNRLDITKILLKDGNQQQKPAFAKSVNSNQCNADAGSSDPASAYISWQS